MIYQSLNHIVGLLGGVIGELLFVLGVVEQFKDNDHYPQFKNINITQEIVSVWEYVKGLGERGI